MTAEQATMNIRLNGESYPIAADCTAEQLLRQLGLGEKKLALEINGEIVSRSRFAQQRIQSGDQVEIIHAVGGG